MKSENLDDYEKHAYDYLERLQNKPVRWVGWVALLSVGILAGAVGLVYWAAS